MALFTYTKKELKPLKACDFKEGDIVDVCDDNQNILYTINISYGIYRRPLKTTVTDKNYKLLCCTPGVRGGWPYYIADFIHKLENE